MFLGPGRLVSLVQDEVRTHTGAGMELRDVWAGNSGSWHLECGLEDVHRCAWPRSGYMITTHGPLAPLSGYRQ